MPSYKEEENGTWTLIYDVYAYEYGKRKRKQKWVRGFKRKKDAHDAYIEFQHEINQGEVEDKNKTVSDLTKAFLEHKQGKIRPNTYRFYEHLIRLYIDPKIGHYKLKSTVERPKLIQDFINDCSKMSNINATTVERIRATLRAAYTLGEFWGWVKKNIVAGRMIELPEKEEFEIVPYTEEQVKTLIEYLVKSDIFLPAIIAPCTGLRRGEVCALIRSDIDFERHITYPKFTLTRVNGELKRTPTKTKRSKTRIVIPASLVEIIKKHLEEQERIKGLMGDAYDDQGFICAWEDGRPYDPDWVTKTFKKVIKKIGLPDIRFHDLRHTFATILADNNIPTKLIQEMMRHSDGRMTERYTHPSMDMQEKAANVIDMKIFKEAANKNANKKLETVSNE